MAKIDAKNKTINSGFCSGNKCVNIGNALNVDLKVCKGTVKSFRGGLTLLAEKRELNSGAFSGCSPPRRGTVRDKQALSEEDYPEVIGTRQSFNVGYEPSDDKSFTAIDDKVVRKKNPKNELFKKTSYGTLSSFNAKGGDSLIDARDATINSGCGAGNNENVNDYLSRVINWNHYECGGTVRSFNAKSGQQITVKHAKVNTGAFAGITTEQGGSSKGKDILSRKTVPKHSGL